MTSADEVRAAAWPRERLGEAIALLAHGGGLIPRPTSFPALPSNGESDPRRTVSLAAEWLGIEAEPEELGWSEVEPRLRGLPPGVFELVVGEAAFLAVLCCRGRRVTVLGPDGERRVLGIEAVASALRRPAEERHGGDVDRLLDDAGITGGRRARARSAMLRQRLGARPVARAWLLRLPPSAPAAAQARRAGLGRLGRRYLAVYVGKQVLWVGAWAVLWRGALEGRVDFGWLWAWALMLFTSLPLRFLEPWYSTLFSIGVGWLLKRRILAGALSLEPEEVRHLGHGQLLSRTIESEAAESETLAAGTLIVAHGVDVVLALPILAAGAGGAAHAVALVLWLGMATALLRGYFLRRERWTEMRLDATHDLVEQMAGFETRLAQERPEERHQGEDEALAAYLRHSRSMDRRAAILAALVPGGWLVLSLGMLTPPVVAGGFATAELALSLGGMLFALLALDMMTAGLLGIADALVAWRKVLGLYGAAARPCERGLPELALASASGSVDGSQPLVEARELVFGYGRRAEPVLRKCDLEVSRGDRVLLEGASGSGKTTLLSLLIGLRRPESGLLLLDGLDRPSLGREGWRRRVVAAPQFHENHVFLGTFAFNLLMGREWPPLPEDFREASEVCRELGLEELLERMPGGLSQMVGEVGWQLSHGERSRLYIARALLQDADLLAFDESFAALDPENLELALRTVLKRAETVLVIAHP